MSVARLERKRNPGNRLSMQDEPGFRRTQSGLPVLAARANFLSLRSSSKRCVTSRMIAAMPCISPASFSGTTVNSTEIVLPSLRSAGTKRRSPGFVPALAGFYGSCEATQWRSRSRSGIMRSSDWPSTSSRAKPNILSAPGFQKRISPWRSAAMMASVSVDSTAWPIRSATLTEVFLKKETCENHKL
jgi:hypothetical protein